MYRRRILHDNAGSGSTADAVQGLDWTTVWLYLILVIIGWMMVYAADHDVSKVAQWSDLYDIKATYGKQTIFIVVAIIIGGATLLTDNRLFKTFAYVFYGFSILLLLVTLAVAPAVHGAHAWIPLGFGFRLQSGEIAKLATALTLSTFLGGHETSLRDNRTLAYTVGIIVLPMVIILLQNDTGSMLVFVSFFLMLYREGMPPWVYLLGIIFAILAVLTLKFNLEIVIMMLFLTAFAFLISLFKDREERLPWQRIGIVLSILSFLGLYFGLQQDDKEHYLRYWLAVTTLVIDFLALAGLATIQYLNKKQQFVLFVSIGLVVAGVFASVVDVAFNNILQPHQQERINVWLNPEKCNPRGALYNVNQSKIAIGSGSILGKGFLHGSVTKMNYVPEQQTDFIFCTVGEEQGFVGSVGLIGLYVFLLLRIIYIGERQRSKFTRVYAYCVAGILFFHFTINMGMTMGMLPVIGIPLPFLSYGGSSLISFTILLAVLVKLDASRNVAFR